MIEEKQKHLKLLRDGDGCFQSIQFEDQGGTTIDEYTTYVVYSSMGTT